MTSKETILTAEGLAKLEAELEELRTVKKNFVLSNAWRMKSVCTKPLLTVISAKTPNMFLQKMNRPALKAAFWSWNKWSIRLR